MYATRHAEDKLRFYRRSGVKLGDLIALDEALRSASALKDSFDVDVPLVEPVLDQSHGNWEYRSILRAIVRDNALVTVYLVA